MDEVTHTEKLLEQYISSFKLSDVAETMPKEYIRTVIDKMSSELEMNPKTFDIDIEEIRALNLISFLWFLMADKDKAFEYNKRALDINRKNIVALANKAWFHLKQQEFSASRTCCDDLENLEDSPLELLIAKAEIAFSYSRFGMQNYKQAEQLFKDIEHESEQIEHVPKEYKCLWKFGIALTMKRQLHFVNTHYEKGKCLTKEGLQSTIMAFLEITEMNIESISRYKARSFVDIGLLVDLFSTTKHHYPKEVTSVFQKCGPLKTISSRYYFEQALRIQPNDVYVLEKSGKYYRYKKEIEHSLRLLKKAVSIRGTSFGHHHLALTLKRQAEMTPRRNYNAGPSKNQAYSVNGDTVSHNVPVPSHVRNLYQDPSLTLPSEQRSVNTQRNKTHSRGERKTTANYSDEPAVNESPLGVKEEACSDKTPEINLQTTGNLHVNLEIDKATHLDSGYTTLESSMTSVDDTEDIILNSEKSVLSDDETLSKEFESLSFDRSSKLNFNAPVFQPRTHNADVTKDVMQTRASDECAEPSQNIKPPDNSDIIYDMSKRCGLSKSGHSNNIQTMAEGSKSARGMHQTKFGYYSMLRDQEHISSQRRGGGIHSARGNGGSNYHSNRDRKWYTYDNGSSQRGYNANPRLSFRGGRSQRRGRESNRRGRGQYSISYNHRLSLDGYERHQDKMRSQIPTGNRSILALIKSPIKLKDLQDNSNNEDIFKHLNKSIELSISNVAAIYDKGLMYRSVKKNDDALDVFKSILVDNRYCSRVQLANVYEQAAFCLIEKEKETANDDEKDRIEYDVKAYLMKSIEITCNLIKNVPFLKDCWVAAPTLQSLLLGKARTKHSLKDLGYLNEKIYHFKEAIGYYKEVLDIEEEDSQKAEILMKIVTNCMKDGNIDDAVLAFDMIMCLPDGYEKIDKDLYVHVHIEGGISALKKREMEMSRLRLKNALDFGRGDTQEIESDTEGDTTDTDSCYQDSAENFDMFILCNQNSNGKGQIIKEALIATGLAVTLNSDDVLPNVYKLTGTQSIMKKASHFVVLLDHGKKKISRTIKHYFEFIKNLKQRDCHRNIVVLRDMVEEERSTKMPPFDNMYPSMAFSATVFDQANTDKKFDWIKELLFKLASGKTE